MAVQEKDLLDEIKAFHLDINEDMIKLADSKCELNARDFLGIVLEEWKDLREEIRVRIEQRTQLTEIMVALVSGLITAASAATFWADTAFLVFAIIPFVTFFFMFLIKASYIRHRWLSEYIQEEIERKRMPIFENPDIHWLYWETYFKRKFDSPIEKKESTNRAQAYNAFNLGTFLICGFIITTYVSFEVILSLCQANYSLSIVLIVAATLLLPIFWIGGLFLIRHSWIKQSDIDGSVKELETQMVSIKKLLKATRVAINFAIYGKKDSQETNQTR